MVIFRMPAEKIRAEKIIEEALAEALSDVMLRSQREIWEDMIGKIMSINDPKIAVEWERQDPQFQNEVGEEAGFSFNEFMASIAKIECSMLKVLAEYGEQQILN